MTDEERMSISGMKVRLRRGTYFYDEFPEAIMTSMGKGSHSSWNEHVRWVIVEDPGKPWSSRGFRIYDDEHGPDLELVHTQPANVAGRRKGSRGASHETEELS